MLLFTSTLLLLLLNLASQCVSSYRVGLKIHSDSSYSFRGYKADTPVPASREVARTEVLAAFQDMIDQLAMLQNYGHNYIRPSVMALLYIERQGYFYHSSIRGAPGGTSAATINIMDNNCPHMHNGNCAEMGAIAIATNPPYNRDISGGYLAVYGGPDGQLQFLAPCSPGGCDQYVEMYRLYSLTKRELHDIEGRVSKDLKFRRAALVV